MALGWAGGAAVESLGLTIRFNSRFNADTVVAPSGGVPAAPLPEAHIAAESATPQAAVPPVAVASPPTTAPAPPAAPTATKDSEKHDSGGRKAELLVEGEGETVHLGSVRRREELFNRLIAMGPQRWEVL